MRSTGTCWKEWSQKGMENLQQLAKNLAATRHSILENASWGQWKAACKEGRWMMKKESFIPPQRRRRASLGTGSCCSAKNGYRVWIAAFCRESTFQHGFSKACFERFSVNILRYWEAEQKKWTGCPEPPYEGWDVHCDSAWTCLLRWTVKSPSGCLPLGRRRRSRPEFQVGGGHGWAWRWSLFLLPERDGPKTVPMPARVPSYHVLIGLHVEA